ncbi:MAG: peptidase, partial [Lachnospiraceae bacterium]|nr:peptidase [Lachnospiraceae bacterium]
MEAFYYNQMSKVEQAVYHAMKTGFSEMATSFLVPRVEAKVLGEVFFRMRLDHPEIFYAVNFKYRSYRDSNNLEIIPEYLFEKSKVKDHQKAMKSRVEKLVRPAAKMSEKEKEQYIHDFICQNVHYDKLKKAYSHEIIGPLGQGVGVCEGIAKTVKILCDQLGIWCIIAISEANPEKQIKYRHAWNIVRIDGKYYHLDATFDNSLGKDSPEIRYDYFNLDDSRMYRDHEPVIWKVPVCSDGEHFYYKEKKISFTKVEEIKKRA